MRYKAGLIIIATGRYDQFVEPLLNSARIHFLPEDDVTFFVFTDKARDYGEDVVLIPIQHEQWPGPTIHRYRNITNSSGLFKAMDYLFYCDADMRFIDTVGREILHDGLTVTLHPGFAMFPGTGSWGNNKLSTSYTPKERRSVYTCGGYQGGSKSAFLLACSIMHMNIVQDESNGVMSEWQDETHWNKLISETSNYKLLSPEYCYPECPKKAKMWKLDHLKPKLLALEKSHAELRK